MRKLSLAIGLLLGVILQISSAEAQSTAPASVGAYHSCVGYYPPEDAVVHRQGKTILGFVITQEGIPFDIRVATSSGLASLDDAATACVKTWKYRPAQVNGQAVAVPWKTEVVWVMAQDGPAKLTYAQLRLQTLRCLAASGIMKSLGDAPLSEMLTLSIQLSPTQPPQITIPEPSGSEKLDSKAAECVLTAPALAEYAKDSPQGRLVRVSLAWRYLLNRPATP